MSADNKNNSEISRVLSEKLIDMTNQFYLEISKNVLSEREYEIIEKILIDKCPIKILSEKYEVGNERIRQIYQNAFYKVKSVSRLLKEIDLLKEKRDQLRKEYLSDYKALSGDRPRKTGFRNKKIIDSSFPFSSRLWNTFNRMEWETLKDLTAIPIREYLKYSGFKGKCMKEFIRFIEFENLEDEFEGFYELKEKYFPYYK
jgi:hypothetical protein